MDWSQSSQSAVGSSGRGGQTQPAWRWRHDQGDVAAVPGLQTCWDPSLTPSYQTSACGSTVRATQAQQAHCAAPVAAGSCHISAHASYPHCAPWLVPAHAQAWRSSSVRPQPSFGLRARRGEGRSPDAASPTCPLAGSIGCAGQIPIAEQRGQPPRGLLLLPRPLLALSPPRRSWLSGAQNTTQRTERIHWGSKAARTRP